MASSARVEVRSPTHDPSLAFRDNHDGTFAGGYLTHAVAITNAGSVAVTPAHWDGTARVIGAAVTLQTATISRGDVAFDASPIAVTSSDNMLTLDRGLAIEHLENREEGVEQSWQFLSQPGGEGDLVVTLNASGFKQVVDNASGVHLFTPGELGVRYSTAVWKDGAGEAWTLATHWDGQHIVVTVPAQLLDASVYPAVLDPIIGTEQKVDVATTGNTGASAIQEKVAYNGTNYLVVWSDQRNGPSADIYGTLVSPAGAVQNAKGIAINMGTSTQTNPVVAFANNKWVVAWNNNGDIGAATVSSAGGSIGQLGNVVATASNEQLPAIASHGTAALLVWQSDSNVRGALFNGSSFGTPFDIDTAADAAAPTVASDGNGNYLVAWTSGTTNQDIKGQLVNANGTLNGTAITISAGSGAQIEPYANFDGTDFVVVWNSNNAVYGSRVTTAGVVSDTHTEGSVVVGGKSLSAVNSVKDTPSISCDNASCLVVWSDRRNLATTGYDLYGGRFDFTFTAVGSEISVSTATRYQVTPASVGVPTGGFLVAWEDQRTGAASLAVASRVDTSGNVQDANGIILNTSANSETQAAYSRGPTAGQIAVWADSRAVGDDIMGVRYDVNGMQLDSPAKVISNAVNEQDSPSVAYDGTQYFAVWTDFRNATSDIYGARMSTSGTLLDTNGIAITTAALAQAAPDVASGNGVTLVVWADRRNSATTGFDIYGALVNPAGTILVSDIVISNAANDQNRPAVVYDATDKVFVVVWGDQRNSSSTDIYGARVDTTGTVLDTAGVQISAAAGIQQMPDIAVDGSTMLAVWEDRRTDPSGDIYGTRLTAAGSLTVLDSNGIAIATTGGQSSATAVGVSGGQFVVAWADTRNMATTQTDIYGNSVDATAGTLGTEFVISNTTDNESQPRFQNDPNDDSNKANLVFSDLRTDLQINRVYRILVTFAGSNGQTCTAANQCSSGFCVDGYCCDQACGGTQNQLPTDCQACSIAHGAATNGTCGVASSQTLCRGYSSGDSYCDLREYCDGINTACPPDLGHHGGLACTGACGSGICPANDASGAPHVCTCP